MEFNAGNGGLALGTPEAEGAPLDELGPISAEEFDCGNGGVIAAVNDDPVGPMLLVKVCPSGPLGVPEKERNPVALMVAVELGRGNGAGVGADGTEEKPADNDPGAVAPDGLLDDVVEIDVLNVAWPDGDVALVRLDPVGALGPTDRPLLFDRGKGMEVKLMGPGPVGTLVVGPTIGAVPFVEVFATEVGMTLNGEPVAPGLTSLLLENGKPVGPEGKRVELVIGKGVVDDLPGLGLRGGTVCPPGPGLDVTLDIAGVCSVFDVTKEVP